MPKKPKKAAINLDEHIKVGEGNEIITEWDRGFDIIDEIDTCLWRGSELDWEKIESALTVYPEFAGCIEGLEGQPEILSLFEKFPGASLAHSFYDHGSPGCSGFYLEAFVTRKNLEYVRNAFSALLEAIKLEKIKNMPANQ